MRRGGRWTVRQHVVVTMARASYALEDASRWLLPLGLAVAFFWFMTSVAFADPSPTGRTPKIFWTPERQALWNQMEAANHPWWQQIKSNANLSGTSNARYADLGQWATMAYQVTGDPTYAAKAYAQASTKLNGGKPDSSRNFTREHFIEFAWMYDWLYPGLTASQRQQWIDSLNYWSDLCLGNIPTVSWGTRLSDSDETTGHYFGMVLWDLASAGDNPRAGTFIPDAKLGGLTQTSTSRTNMRNAVADYVRRAAGGVWIESSKYNMGTLQLLLMGAEGVKTAVGSDQFPEVTALLKDVALAQMQEVTPDLREAFQWGDNEDPHSLNADRRTSLMNIVGGLLQNDASIAPYVRNFADRIGAAEEPEFRWMILGNPYVPSADFRGILANGHVAPGMGIELFHDGRQSNQSLFGSHMASRSTVDHEVHYLSNFDLYRGGEAVISHVIGYDANESEHHNSMLIAGLSNMQEARGPLAGEFGADYAYHVGSTGGNRYTNGYYNPPPRFLHEWTRSLLYLPSADAQHDTIVVFDRVNAEDPKSLVKLDRYSSSDLSRINGAPARKQWILHAPVTPTLTTGGFTWQTSGGQTVRVATLLPVNPTRTIYSDSGLNLSGTIRSSELRYQIRLAPQADQRWDTFLNVIQAYSGSPSLTNALVSSTNGAAQGALIRRPNHPDVLALFDAAQGPDLPASKVVSSYLQVDSTLLDRLNTNRLFSSGYTVTWSAAASSTTVFLADLDPATQWFAAVDGQPEAALAVSPQGLARRTVSGAGSHTLQLRAAGQVTDTTPPTIANVQITNVSSTAATLTWTTNEPATGQAEYGVTASYGQLSSPTTSLATSQSLTLTGLLPATLYHVRVHAADAAGNQATSADLTLTTATAGTASFQEVNGTVSIETEAYDAKIPRNGQDWVFETSTAGFSGQGYLRALPNLGANINTGYVTTSPELIYNVQFNTPGTYYVWVHGQANSSSDDSVHVGLDGIGISTADRIGDFPPAWTWLRDTMDLVPASVTVATPGLHTVHIWMRQDGLGVDQLVLRLDPSATPPSGGTPPPVNQPPVLSAIGPQSVTAENPLTIALSGTDPDGDALTFSALGLPSGAVLNGATFTWTPARNQVGPVTVTFGVSDGSLSDTEAVVITVLQPANASPVLNSIGAKSVMEGSRLLFSISASDPDGDPLTLTATGLPAGAVLTNGVFDWTTTMGQAGAYTVTFTVSDGSLSDSETVPVTVTHLNQPPVLTAINPQTVAEGQALTLALVATDPDGSALTFSASGLPAGAILNGSTLSWTPAFDQAGTYSVTFTVSDGALSASQTATLTVTNVNRAPAAEAGPVQTVNAGSVVTLDGTGSTDPDGDVLTYQFIQTAGPAITLHNPPPAQPTFTAPAVTAPTTLTFSLTVSDGTTSAQDTVTITVQPVVAGPVLLNPITTTGRVLSTGSVAIGGKVYLDRTYTFASVPAAYLGLTNLLTANDEKFVNTNPYLTFTLTVPSTVYAAFDARSTKLPSWLDKPSWVKTGEQVKTTDTTFWLYKRTFPAGPVVLGSNNMWPQRGAQSHYFLFVAPQ